MAYKDEKLEQELAKLHTIVDGVKATVIVSIDGLLVAAYPADDDGADEHVNPTASPQVAAMAATLIGLAEKTLGRLAQGSMERLLIEGEDGTMVVYPAGRRAAVAVLVERTAHMGHVLFATKKTASEVQEILGN